jgi:uncharacterized protein (TIGR02217 family)
MPSFHEVRLPTCISLEAQGGPRFYTTIMTLSSGYEKRNINWSQVRAEYDIGYAIKTPEVMAELRAFFYARRGRAYGFRFKDHGDYLLERQKIGDTDGSTSEFQIYKRYSSAGVDYDRNLYKIVSNADAETDLSVWVDGSLLTEGGGDTGYTVNRNLGIITIGAIHASTIGKDIEVRCEFDNAVRFDTDHFNVTLVTKNIQSCTSLPLVEVRDIS